MEYEARYVFIQPPSTEVLAARLREGGRSAEEADAAVARAAEDIEHGKAGGYDKLIVNDDVDTACKDLEDFIYGREEPASLTNGVPGTDADAKAVDGVDSNGATA